MRAAMRTAAARISACLAFLLVLLAALTASTIGAAHASASGSGSSTYGYDGASNNALAHLALSTVGRRVDQSRSTRQEMPSLTSWSPAALVVAAEGEAQVLTNKAIGEAAADSIAGRYPGAMREATLQAESGIRRLDVLTEDGLAIESKVGRTSLTSRVQQQIGRDVELLNNPLSPVSSLRWEFGRSPITGLGGPTRPLQAALEKAGIPWFFSP
jgi:hypothetical protein